MAIWKKQNKEASRPNEKENTVNEARDKVSLSDEDLEKAAGGGDNLYSWIITTSGGPKSEQP